MKQTIPKYVALGDSMTIDQYPCSDAKSRFGRNDLGLGAASLTFKNNDELFPDFVRRDLHSMLPGLRFVSLASDGATLDTVEHQLDHVDRSALIISLTVGGNDLLQAYAGARSGADLTSKVNAICDYYRRVVARIRSIAPQAFLLLNTVYDPTDGTGRMPGVTKTLPVEFLHQFNACVKETANEHRACFVDIWKHFLGHGVSARPEDRWYWNGSIIEPSFEGANEIRRLWTRVLRSSTAYVTEEALALRDEPTDPAEVVDEFPHTFTRLHQMIEVEMPQSFNDEVLDSEMSSVALGHTNTELAAGLLMALEPEDDSDEDAYEFGTSAIGDIATRLRMSLMSFREREVVMAVLRCIARANEVSV